MHSPRSAWLFTLGLALSAPCVLACAGAPTPPAEPKAGDAPAVSAAAAPDTGHGMASGAAAPAPSAGFGTSGASGAGTAASSGSPAPADSAGGQAAQRSNDRVEDMARKKVNSAGGGYTVSVLSAAGLAADDVGKVVNGASGKSDDCYAKLFKKQMGVNGHTTFDVTISTKGKTQAVKLRSDDMKNPDLEKCLETLVKGLEWPTPTEKAGGKTTIEWVVSGN